MEIVYQIVFKNYVTNVISVYNCDSYSTYKRELKRIKDSGFIIITVNQYTTIM